MLRLSPSMSVGRARICTASKPRRNTAPWQSSSNLLLRCAVLVGLILSTPAVMAQVGTVLATAGKNEITQRSGATVAVRNGSKLDNGDTITTGPAGFMQMRFSDGAIVSLRPRSVFRIDEYQYPSSQPRSFLSLLRGALRTATGAISNKSPESYRLTTPSATIGVRGTHFLVEETVCTPQCPLGKTAGLHISVSQGAIIVSNDAGNLELSAGEAARVANKRSSPVKTALAPTLAPRAYQPNQPPFAETKRPWRSQVALGSSEPSEQRPDPRSESPDKELLAQAPGEANGDEPVFNPSTEERTERIADSGGWSPNDDSNTGDDTLAQAPGNWSLADGSPLSEADRLSDTSPPTEQAPTFPALPELATPTVPNPIEPIELPRDDAGQIDLVGWLPPTIEPTQPGANASNENPNEGGGGNDSSPSVPGSKPPGAGQTPAPAPGTLSADRWRIDLRAVPLISRIGLVANAGAVVTFNDNTELQAIGICPNLICLSRGSARVAEAGHDAYAAWGRWTDGSLTLSIAGIEGHVALSDRDGLHYLVGVPALSLPAQGTFGYQLVGATAATASTLGWAPGQFTGAAAVQFGPASAPKIGLEAQINIGNEQFNFATQGGLANPGASELSANDQASFQGTIAGGASPSVPWYCGSSACAVSIDGALLGPSGERLGLGYSVISESGSTTIDGVAVFARP